MPTIHREYGFNFVIYVDDHPPPHVHVTGRGFAKIMLVPTVTVAEDRELTKGDVRRLLNVVKAQRETMIAAWNRVHG